MTSTSDGHQTIIYSMYVWLFTSLFVIMSPSKLVILLKVEGIAGRGRHPQFGIKTFLTVCVSNPSLLWMMTTVYQPRLELFPPTLVRNIHASWPLAVIFVVWLCATGFCLFHWSVRSDTEWQPLTSVVKKYQLSHLKAEVYIEDKQDWKCENKQLVEINLSSHL